MARGVVKGPVNGLVLLGLGWRSARKGFGEARRVSWERLREGGGGASKEVESLGSGAAGGVCSTEENREVESKAIEQGMVEEEKDGEEDEVWREAFRDRDWVFIQELEENRSEVSESKGSGFHCASLWTPFIPLVCQPEDCS